MENATGGAAGKVDDETERQRAFQKNCAKCWKVSTKECSEAKAAAKASGWTVACKVYKDKAI